MAAGFTPTRSAPPRSTPSSSGPASWNSLGYIASTTVTRSPTVRVNSPGTSSDGHSVRKPARSVLPCGGTSPAIPQYDAGRIVDPPVWLPSATGTCPAATAAADPLEEPPGVRPRSRGLAVGPGAKYANSVVTVLPTTTAPSDVSSATSGAVVSTRSGEVIGDPQRVGRPATSMMSLTPSGIPASATSRCASRSAACSPAANTTHARSSSSVCAIRSRDRPSSSRASQAPCRTASARSATGLPRTSSAGRSGSRADLVTVPPSGPLGGCLTSDDGRPATARQATQASPVRSGQVRSGPIRSGHVRSGPGRCADGRVAIHAARVKQAAPDPPGGAREPATTPARRADRRPGSGGLPHPPGPRAHSRQPPTPQARAHSSRERTRSYPEHPRQGRRPRSAGAAR